MTQPTPGATSDEPPEPPVTPLECAPPRPARVVAIYVALLGLVWLVMTMTGARPFDPRWALESRSRDAIDVWRVLGHAFVHSDFLHLANNALILWLTGRPLERMIGARAMLLVLLLGVVAGALVPILIGLDGSIVGASGAGFAVIGAGLIAAIRGWTRLGWRTRLRLVALLFLLLVQWPLLLLGDIHERLSLGPFVVEFYFRPETFGPVSHLVHAASFVVGVVVALVLLVPEPWLGRPRRPRALATTAAVLSTVVLCLAFFLRTPPTWTMAEANECVTKAGRECEELYERFGEACAGGDPVACHNVGYFLDEAFQLPLAPAAVPFYRRGCDGGYVASCLNLTLLLRSGRVRADPPLARRVAATACTSGLSLACHALGFDQLQGQGGPQDDEAARVSLRTACEGGRPNACSDLGALLWEGRGGAADREQALSLFERACESGVAPDGCDNAQMTRAAAERAAADGAGRKE